MPTTAFKFSELRDRARLDEPPPPGVYDVTCIATEAGTTRTGKGMIKARYSVNSGPEKGKLIFDNHVLSPESEAALYFFFENIGVAHDVDLDRFDTTQLATVAAQMVGAVVRVNVEHGEYNDRVTAEVKSYQKLGKGGPGAPPKKKAKAGPKPPPKPKALDK